MQGKETNGGETEVKLVAKRKNYHHINKNPTFNLLVGFQDRRKLW